MFLESNANRPAAEAPGNRHRYRSSQKRRRRNLTLESLERRELMSANPCCPAPVAAGAGGCPAAEVRESTPAAPLRLDGGNTLRQATDLGCLRSSVTLRDSLCCGDSQDYYKFRVTSSRNALEIKLTFPGAAAAAQTNVELLNARGHRIALPGRCSADGQTGISIVVPAGTYYLHMCSASDVPRYCATITSRGIGADGRNGSLATATNVALPTDVRTHVQSRSLVGFVGEYEPDKFFKFRCLQGGNITINFRPESARARIQLLDSAGRVAWDSQFVNGPTQTTLAIIPGTYYVHVCADASHFANTWYQLGLTIRPR